MNEKSGAERLPPLDIGHSVLDIECSEKEVDTQDRGYLNQAETLRPNEMHRSFGQGLMQG